MVNLTIDNVGKRYGAVITLDRVSVNIARGELYFLLGPSGCGKTTLLRIIAGFTRADEGRVLVDGRDITDMPPQRRDMAMVFQSYALWPHLTVEANVDFGLRVRRVPRAQRRARTAEALELVQMGPYARRKPNQLSGGQQQRVALARALVTRPRCLLLDEPLSNLDARLRLEMRGEIRRLCKEAGLTAIYVTHDQKEAMSIADAMAVLFGGRVAQAGAPRDVYRRPASRQVADFLGGSNFLAGEIVGRDADVVRVRTPLGLVLARAASGGPSAGACLVLIRPESFMMQAGGGANCFEATCESVTYLGETEELTLRVADSTLRVAVMGGAADRAAPGRRVMVGADPSDVVLLPPDEVSPKLLTGEPR